MWRMIIKDTAQRNTHPTNESGLTSHGGIKGREEDGFVLGQNRHVLREVIESRSVVTAQVLNVVPLEDLVIFSHLRWKERVRMKHLSS